MFRTLVLEASTCDLDRLEAIPGDARVQRPRQCAGFDGPIAGQFDGDVHRQSSKAMKGYSSGTLLW